MIAEFHKGCEIGAEVNYNGGEYKIVDRYITGDYSSDWPVYNLKDILSGAIVPSVSRGQFKLPGEPEKKVEPPMTPTERLIHMTKRVKEMGY